VVGQTRGKSKWGKNMKYCKDCKHMTVLENCKKTQLTVVVEDPVNGKCEKQELISSCIKARSTWTECGQDAKWFEPNLEAWLVSLFKFGR
jgi:hypothetical protein